MPRVITQEQTDGELNLLSLVRESGANQLHHYDMVQNYTHFSVCFPLDLCFGDRRVSTCSKASDSEILNVSFWEI